MTRSSSTAVALTDEERVARARADLRMGAPIALLETGEDAGTGAGALVLAAETLRADRLAGLRALCVPEALGSDVLLDLAITHRRAETLRARAYDGTIARIAVPATAQALWIRATADPSADMATPLKGPYLTRRDGSAALHSLAITLTKQARLLPAALLLVSPNGAAVAALAREAELTCLDASVVAGAADAQVRMRRVSGARVPLALAEHGRVHVFRPDDGGEEHYAVEIGDAPRDAPVLARLHSACFTGDVIGSLKCDCGPQLAAALTQIADEGTGVILYMNQEGRGIGLANKMRAYALQDEGFDTVEANHRLGFEDDERDFRLGAEMLKAMGFSATRLMTNNPGKLAMMRASGVAVTERVPLKVGLNPLNERYLATKAAKSGHLL
ncbi:MAG: GTP cyclohydrolase II [Pseudomonadota bacterium]